MKEMVNLQFMTFKVKLWSVRVKQPSHAERRCFAPKA